MNKDHTWSHKRGATEVQLSDATDNIIYDPKFADRNYKPTGGLDYSIFVGYYEVGKCDIDE